MKKYISLLLMTFFRKKPQIQNNGEDYNVLYGEDGEEYNDEFISENNINLNQSLITNKNPNNNNNAVKNSNNNIIINGRRKSKFMFEMSELDQGKKLNSMMDTVEIVTREMQINDFYKILLAIWLTTHHDSNYDTDEFLINNENSYSHGRKSTTQKKHH